MNADVVPYLRCPVCHAPLAAALSGLRCTRGHSFDRARQGYVSLVAGALAHQGDTADMVAARERFLAAGHYHFISAALASATGPGGFILDPGGGTGHHLAAVLDARPGSSGLILDVSKPALRRAARVHPRAAAALADTWRTLPVADGAAAAVLNVFAPRNAAEFHRVLAPGGTLLVVIPTAAHLSELVSALRLLTVDPAKTERVGAALARHFAAGEAVPLERRLRLSRDEARTAVEMGPSAWHTDRDALDRALAALPEPIEVTASVTLTPYQPLPNPSPPLPASP